VSFRLSSLLRSSGHFPRVSAGEVCPVGSQLHHVQRRGRVHVPQQPVRLPVCRGVPTMQLSHHGHPDHGEHAAGDGRVLEHLLQGL